MTNSKVRRSFGDIIRERRRKLDLTQNTVAHRIQTSTPYIGHLEAGKRHPSDKVIGRLAAVLGLDRRELFFLANPEAHQLVEQAGRNRRSSWEAFRGDTQMRRLHSITHEEMELLSRVAAMGEVGSPRDFVYVLTTVRHALGR